MRTFFLLSIMTLCPLFLFFLFFEKVLIVRDRCVYLLRLRAYCSLCFHSSRTDRTHGLLFALFSLSVCSLFYARASSQIWGAIRSPLIGTAGLSFHSLGLFSRWSGQSVSFGLPKGFSLRVIMIRCTCHPLPAVTAMPRLRIPRSFLSSPALFTVFPSGLRVTRSHLLACPDAMCVRFQAPNTPATIEGPFSI